MSHEADAPAERAVDDEIVRAVFVSRLRPSPAEAWEAIGPRYASLARGALSLSAAGHEIPSDPAESLKYGVALAVQALQRAEMANGAIYTFDENELERLFNAEAGPAEETVKPQAPAAG